jgi:UDP-N-acetylmuramoylalanine--D-glutamate ligase
VLRKLGFSSSQANMALKSFRGIPGRNEMVLRKDNAMYVNDSSSLIPAATNFTMENFENLPVHLICGGSDISLDASVMLGSLKGAASVHLLCGSFTEKKLIPMLRKHRIKFNGPYEKMEEAVYSASSCLTPEAQILQVVLLSPGSGAYEHFTSEFNRGEAFRNAVLNLQDR